jgi:gliding motility-associated-like protein
MNKYSILLVLLFFSCKEIFANHISGGEIIYEYLGPGGSANTKQYRITLRLFRDNDGGGANMPLSVRIAIYSSDNSSALPGSPFTVNRAGISSVPVDMPPPCMTEPPILNYSVGVFSFIVDLPNNSNGYIAAYQTCCRIFPLQNVFTQDQPAQGEGSTYVARIPGNNQLQAGVNSSPQFVTQLAPVCYNSNFTLNFGATDPDGDSLVFYFCDAYNRGVATSSADVTPPPPPYSPVSYINGFSAAVPLGPLANLNTTTGLISGIAPTQGNYVVCVCINEYRNGVLIGNHRKDFILTVSNCNIAKATLNPKYINCGLSSTITFQNNTPGINIQTYYWDFGDGNISTQTAPTHTYTTAGDYTLKLVVNRGLACADSTTSIVKVYPGFFPNFTVAGQCKNTPIQFTDISNADYGFIDTWKWDFGDAGSPTNTSTIPNPTHTYLAARSYNVNFIVTSSKGCIATVPKTILITDKPALELTNDTLICIIDTLQLNAVGIGTFLWSPNYNINSLTIPSPLVSPDVDTVYRVTITDPFGCIGTDSVKVRVVSAVTQFAPKDTTICKTDGVVLKLTSDALYYQWTEDPVGNTLNNPKIKNPVATPVTNTIYTVVGSIGKCVAQNNIPITVVPYPKANAGPDPSICFGFSAQLNASGGSFYSWSPTTFLNNRSIPNPISQNPTASLQYIVTVTDTLGCPKPVNDTVLVTVIKIKANAGPSDTSVVLGQPLLLNATGSNNFLWDPPRWLSKIDVYNPISFPQDDITYKVKVFNNIGCFNYDTIKVHLFKLDPSFYVPNAFTPNGDGTNDFFGPKAIGMKSLDIFRVYNRWGQLLFSSTDIEGRGWDGTFAGRGQDAATYVWYAEGTNYLDVKIKKKGYVVLIR